MQYLIPLLIGGLIDVCGSLVGRVLLALGMSFVTYAGFDALLGVIKAQIISDVSGAGSVAASFLSFMYVDKGISMIFSAVAVSLVLKGLTNGSLSKLVTKG